MAEPYTAAAGAPEAATAVRGAWLATAVLFFAFLFNYADRALPSLFMEPLKASFHATDTEVALLTGFSFAVSISVFALPVSWLADRRNRPRLITAGILVWCGMTIGCGLARDFWVLFALRMGVGLGEAVLSPAAYSLIADLFPPGRVARPLGILILGRVLGTVLALNGGGWLFARLGGGEDGWRGTMIAFGAAGLLLALFTWAMPEPRRSAPQPEATVRGGEIALWPLLRGSAPFFLPFVLSMSLWAMYDAGFQAWLAPFFQRTYHWPIKLIGRATGTATLISGLLGTPLGAWLVLRVNRRLHRDAPVTALWLLTSIIVPLTVLMPLSSSGDLAVVLLGVLQLPGAAASAIAPVIFVQSAPPYLRARIFAASSLCFGLLGWGFGAVVYAMFTQYVVRDPAKLYLSMSIVSGVLTGVSTLLIILSDRAQPALRARLARLAERAAATPGAVRSRRGASRLRTAR